MVNHICGVVISARDEEEVIGRCLESLIHQTVRPFIVVVNDGSVDRTSEIASMSADVVEDLPRHKESWAGKPELARIFNIGFNVLKREKIDYVMISGADAMYSSNYIEDIIQKMSVDNIVIASGVAHGESVTDSSPRGCGRIIQAGWFRKVGFRYPENFGFEAYIVFKALSQGVGVKIYRDLEYVLSRETRFSNKKMFSWGKGMRALNYWWLYALGRSMLLWLRHPLGGYNLLKGYYSDVSLYDDVKEFIPNYQRKIILRRIKNVLLGEKNN